MLVQPLHRTMLLYSLMPHSLARWSGAHLSHLMLVWRTKMPLAMWKRWLHILPTVVYVLFVIPNRFIT